MYMYVNLKIWYSTVHMHSKCHSCTPMKSAHYICLMKPLFFVKFGSTSTRGADSSVVAERAELSAFIVCIVFPGLLVNNLDHDVTGDASLA